jgi:CMP-N-acetylneuraminic acid synthetase
MNINAIVLIPAKSHSTRLPNKNISKINGKTLIEHSIAYAKLSKYVKEIFVSSDSEHIKEIAYSNNVKYINRPKNLLGEAEVADIYADFIKKIDYENYNYLVGLQPDHPDRNNNLDKLLNYAQEKKYMDLFTVNQDGSRNGSVRILEIKYLIEGKVSRRVGSVMDNCTNIETLETFLKAKKKLHDNL